MFCDMFRLPCFILLVVNCVSPKELTHQIQSSRFAIVILWVCEMLFWLSWHQTKVKALWLYHQRIILKVYQYAFYDVPWICRLRKKSVNVNLLNVRTLQENYANYATCSGPDCYKIKLLRQKRKKIEFV